MSKNHFVKGYRIISVPIDNKNAITHQLYIKEHNDKNHKGSTLFVGNIDCVPEMTQENVDSFLRCIFDSFGDIESISLSELGKNITDKSRFAHINYAKKTAVKMAFSAKDEEYQPLLARASTTIGLQTELNNLTRAEIRSMFPLFDVNTKQLQENVDNFMIEFDAEEKLKEEEEDRKANVPDEDGFIVVRKKRKRGADDMENSDPKLKRGDKKKKKDTELKNFYRFQIREEKMKQLDQLRKKFEEDKKKVERMKATRKFNPF